MKRKDPTQTEGKAARISLAYKIPLETPEGKTLHYLLHNPKWNNTKGRAMVLDSIRAFWAPLAYFEEPSDDALQIAQNAIEVLEDQIMAIRRRFGIPNTRKVGLVLLDDELSTSPQTGTTILGKTENVPITPTNSITVTETPTNQATPDTSPVAQTPLEVKNKAPEFVSLDADPEGLYTGLDNALFL